MEILRSHGVLAIQQVERLTAVDARTSAATQNTDYPKVHFPIMDLKYIAAPMVNQSDLPFRLLTRKYGATTTYTQMYLPDKLLNDQEYQEYHIRDLTLGGQSGINRPVVAQLCGHDPETIVQAGRKIQGYCDAIGQVFRVVSLKNF